jgi:hypothetical protein
MSPILGLDLKSMEPRIQGDHHHGEVHRTVLAGTQPTKAPPRRENNQLMCVCVFTRMVMQILMHLDASHSAINSNYRVPCDRTCDTSVQLSVGEVAQQDWGA